MGSIRRNEGGNPPRLFDFIRRVCLTLFDMTRRGGPPRRVPLMFFDATRHRTPGVCPFGRTLGVRAQMGTFYVSGGVSNTEHQKHARFGVFLCSAPSPSQGCLLPYHPSLAGSILIN